MNNQADRNSHMAHREKIEFGYEISSAQDAGIIVTDEMRARMARLAADSHRAEDQDPGDDLPTSRAS